jgi:hypothetical protein
MNCRRAFDIDLAAFMVDPSAPGFAEFDAHYPSCADCAAEVAVWRELEEQLRWPAVVASDEHPDELLLLKLEDDPRSLTQTDRMALEAHVSDCPSCRDELVALRGFEMPATGEQEEPSRPTWRDRVTELAGRGRALLLHPAFAYALVFALLIPIVVTQRAHLPSAISMSGDRSIESVPGGPIPTPAASSSAAGATFEEHAMVRALVEPSPTRVAPALRAHARSTDELFGSATTEGASSPRASSSSDLSTPQETAMVSRGSIEPDRPEAERAMRATDPTEAVTARQIEPAPPPRGRQAERGLVSGLGAGSMTAAKPTVDLARSALRLERQGAAGQHASGLAESSRWPLRITADKIDELKYVDVRDGATLRLPPPARGATAYTISVQITRKDGMATPAKAFDLSITKDHLDVFVRAGWLGPGGYIVVVEPSTDAGEAPNRSIYEFVITR